LVLVVITLLPLPPTTAEAMTPLFVAMELSKMEKTATTVTTMIETHAPTNAQMLDVAMALSRMVSNNATTATTTTWTPAPTLARKPGVVMGLSNQARSAMTETYSTATLAKTIACFRHAATAFNSRARTVTTKMTTTMTLVQTSASPLCGDGFVQSGEECDDANTRNGDGCSSSCQVEGGGSITPCCPSGEAQVVLVLDTDRYAFTENALYFFDEGAPDEDYIWIAPTRGILSNHRYELSECVQTSKCYKFYFFDTYGDGLFDGGLTVKYNGQYVLDVKTYEVGEKWEDGAATVYWRRTLGNCSD
jgi:cysteine-rich repeat protein